MEYVSQFGDMVETVVGIILGDTFAPDDKFVLADWVFSRAGLIILFVTCLEFLFPLEQRKFSRRNFLTITYFTLAFKSGVFVFYIIPFMQWAWIHYHLPTLHLDVNLPLWLYYPVAVLTINLADYWAHRIMHRVPLFWHIHKIHHATEHLNWGSNYHRHFAMGLVAGPLVTVVTLMLGTHLVPPFGFIHMMVEHLQHANIRFRFGWLNYIVALPEVHRYHHSTEPRHYDRNFSGGFMIWDHVFGTFHYDPKAPALKFGLDEPIPTDYIGQQIAPLRWIARDVRKKWSVLRGAPRET
jgi:sterol desaturase/sphingolipid hydroxylase (fatty acid hydroxylase superfamily)